MYVLLIFSLFLAISRARSHIGLLHSEPHDYCYLIKRVCIDQAYHQIVLLIDNDEQQIRAQTDFLKKCILQEHPTMLIDFYSLHAVANHMRFPSFGSPRSTTFHMLLYHRDSDLNFQKVFDNYTEIWPRSIRPKWLSIDLSGSSIKYKQTLLYAWQYKFLDFTIAAIKGYNQSVIHNYNPFAGQFAVEQFNDSTEIFPDKMRNLHGYSLKTIFVYEPPTLYLEHDEFGKVIDINGTDYWNIVTLSEILNFNLTMLPTFADDYTSGRKRASFEEMCNFIYNGTIDFSGNQLYVWGNDSLQLSSRLRPGGLCALLPIRRQQRIELPKNFNIILGLSAIYIILMALATRIMNFQRESWTLLTLIRVLLGVAIPKMPFTLRERVLMGSIILFSFFYASDFYSKMTDLKVKTDNVEMSSFEELDQCGLIPLVYHQYYRESFAFVKGNEAVKNLKAKAKFWSNPATCADLLVRRNNTNFCILPENLSRDMVSKFRKKKDCKKRLTIMKPCFMTTWTGYAFTPASPYVEKFDLILSRMAESGLMTVWTQKTRPRQILVGNSDDSDKRLAKVLMWIVIVGYSISGCAFLLELAFFKWRFCVN